MVLKLQYATSIIWRIYYNRVKVTQSCSTLCDPNSPGQNTEVGSLSLLQGNLPYPGIEPRSPTLQVDSLPAEPPGRPKNIGVGILSLLQWIFLNQEWNWGLQTTGGFFTS